MRASIFTATVLTASLASAQPARQPPAPPAPAPDGPAPTPDAPAPEPSAPDAPAPGQSTPPPPATDAPPSGVPSPDELADRLEDRIDELERKTKKLERAQHSSASTKERVDALDWLQRYITAFIDVGAFAVGGNGAGIRNDSLHANYPGYASTVPGQWVFMGDPFTTAVNTLGEPADTADSREVPSDSIHSRGRPSLIVNSIGLSIGRWVTPEFHVLALALLLPRPGPDQLDIPYAYVEYKPWPREVFFYAGKVDSVLGVEYRWQEPLNRTGITPSLICRYTCGRPFGLRVNVNHERFSGSAAIVNGDNFEERFEPDTSIKANRAPTGALHLQWKLGKRRNIELGASGAYGPQDNQSDLDVRQWHYGFDLVVRNARGFDIYAEYVQGHQRGATSDPMGGIPQPACDVAACLRYKGAYVLVDYAIRGGRFTPYARFDWRDATHQSGADFVYEANSIRTTAGLNVRVTDNGRVHAKAEYNWNHELGVPSFPHDVVTASLVVSTE